jgi:hypothetical protein
LEERQLRGRVERHAAEGFDGRLVAVVSLADRLPWMPEREEDAVLVGPGFALSLDPAAAF